MIVTKGYDNLLSDDVGVIKQISETMH